MRALLNWLWCDLALAMHGDDVLAAAMQTLEHARPDATWSTPKIGAHTPRHFLVMAYETNAPDGWTRQWMVSVTRTRDELTTYATCSEHEVPAENGALQWPYFF